MPRGFAHPYLLIAAFVILGVGITLFAGSKSISGIVLGAKTPNENIYQNNTDGLKIVVISPSSSWDLVQYLCTTREECVKTPTTGKWWSTLSGASTTLDGHEVFIEKSEGWKGYPYIKVLAKSSSGTAFKLVGSNEPYLMTSTTFTPQNSFVFEVVENN